MNNGTEIKWLSEPEDKNYSFLWYFSVLSVISFFSFY